MGNEVREFFDKIEKWQEQVARFNRCESDHDRCPICSDQLFFCHCHHDLAQEALETLYSGDTASKVVFISTERLKHLTEAEDKLARLEAYGVDNWSGYSDALSDPEGIFEEEEEG